MQLYLSYIALQLKIQMQYKASLLLSTFGQFITAFTAFFGIRFMFARFNAVEGYTYNQVLMCFGVVVMAFSLGELFGSGFAVFSTMLGNGEFDRALVRPRSPILQVLGSKFDLTRLGLFAQAVVTLCYAIPQSGIIWAPDKVVTLILMICCGGAVFFGLFLVFAGCSFFIVEGLEFLNILTYGGREFGRYPFAIYGEGILRFLTFVVPLAMFQYYPLNYLLGIETSRLYMLSPLASLIFLLPCYGLFRFGISRYKSTGS